jgi:signal transduction histidine kinase
MAAKGEMAAEIGHELRNQLVAIVGRAQLLIRDSEREQYGSVGRHSQIILEQARRVEAMSKGLMDFSRAELKVERVDLNALVQRSVEFVRPQNRSTRSSGTSSSPTTCRSCGAIPASSSRSC